MVTKQPRSARQSEPVCYKCYKKGHYALQCHSRQETTSYRCNKEGHCANECPIKLGPLDSCNYCHHKGHIAEDCFVWRSNEAIHKQDVRILRKNSADDSSNKHLAKGCNVKFVEQENDETVAAFKCSTTSERLTKQHRMQKDLAEYSKPEIRTDPRTKLEPALPAPQKMGKGARKLHESQLQKHLSKHQANLLKNMI